MGSILGKAMDENMAKQQQFMLQNQQMQMERQMEMQNVAREQQMAIALARARDLFLWYGSFYALALFGGVAGFMKNKKPAFIAPLVPLTIILGYQWDMAYGNKMIRIRDDARYILMEKSHLLDLPQPMPNIAQLDERRKRSQ